MRESIVLCTGPDLFGTVQLSTCINVLYMRLKSKSSKLYVYHIRLLGMLEYLFCAGLDRSLNLFHEQLS